MFRNKENSDTPSISSVGAQSSPETSGNAKSAPKENPRISSAASAGPQTPNERNDAYIGAQIDFQGEISGSASLKIAGKFKGTINLQDGTVTIEESGNVKAELNAKNVIVEGKFSGDMVGGDTIHIMSTGDVSGNLKAANVVLDNQCQFNGSIEMNRQHEAAAKPQTVNKPASAPQTEPVKKQPETPPPAPQASTTAPKLGEAPDRK